MNYGAIKKTDIANGPGVRVSLFVSGCTHRCKGCFNQETWDFGYGNPFTDDTQRELLEALSPSYIAGLSVLGGEPFEPQNQRELLGESRARCEVTDEILRLIDVIVDGEFIEEQKNIMLRFKGSENQRIIDVKRSLAAGAVVEAQLD